MRSPAAAFAWEFGHRLRWGLIALGVYLAVLATVQFLVLGPRSALDPARTTTFAFMVLVPLSFAFMYLLAVFSYGLAGDLAARHSLYPARMFTLPVSTAALAGWPMLYGTTVMAAFWVAAALLGLWPSGVHAPLFWPALFGAAFLAWMQVLTWMPYGLPGMRVVAAVLWLTGIDAVVVAAIEYQVRESVMVALMAPQVPLAYLAARFAVARARRGDVPDWRGAFARLGRTAAAPRARGGFPSAAHAQAWLEWRQHGRSLPVWTAIVLPFQLLLLFVARDEPAVLTFVTLAGMLLTPPFLAAFVALTVGRSSPEAAHSYGLTPFTATRPLGTAALVAAKLRMAMASTLAAWLLVAVALPLGLTLCGTWPVVLERARRLAGFVGAPRAVVFAVLCLLGLLATTWKQLVQGLLVGLTGREGLIKASVLLRLSSLILIGPAVHVLSRSQEARIALWNAAPWIPAVLVALKMGAAAWIGTRLSRGRLLGARALVTGAASWVVAVMALYGVFAWLLAAAPVAHSFLLLLAILAVPLARPSAVPLALAWNRHQGARAPSTRVRSGPRPLPRTALALVSMPVALALVLAVSFHVRNRNNGALVSSGEAREYLLHVPKSYDPSRPAPLVISMHGADLWPAAQMEISRWNTVADENGFIVVYPSGVGGRGPRVWRMDGEAPDVHFIADLIDRLEASYNIDPSRIYADGLSNGGGMAFVLSCTLSDRVAAVGLVASAQLLPWSWCTDRRPVPMIAFHGTGDRLAPYHGGTSPVVPRHPLPSIPDWTASWARRNGCGAKPDESAVAADVTRLEYTGCSNDAAVVLYTIHGGGHTWPGGGPAPEWLVGRMSNGVDATRRTWAFFGAHSLSR